MAYSTSAGPQLVEQAICGRKKWLYTNTDASSVVAGSSYITDAVALGMGVGDHVVYFNSSALTPHSYMVSSLNTASANLTVV